MPNLTIKGNLYLYDFDFHQISKELKINGNILVEEKHFEKIKKILTSNLIDKVILKKDLF